MKLDIGPASTAVLMAEQEGRLGEYSKGKIKKAPMFSHVSNAGKQIQEANRFHGHSNKRRQKKQSEQSVVVG